MAQKRARLTDENNPLRSKTDDFLDGLGQVNQLSSQEVNNPASKKAGNTTSQEVIKPTSEQANKSKTQEAVTLRKATFKLSEVLLKRLDSFHLRLQLELGKAETPYKEVFVEEAISQLLDQAELTPDEVLTVLRARQESRE